MVVFDPTSPSESRLKWPAHQFGTYPDVLGLRQGTSSHREGPAGGGLRTSPSPYVSGLGRPSNIFPNFWSNLSDIYSSRTCTSLLRPDAAPADRAPTRTQPTPPAVQCRPEVVPRSPTAPRGDTPRTLGTRSPLDSGWAPGRQWGLPGGRTPGPRQWEACLDLAAADGPPGRKVTRPSPSACPLSLHASGPGRPQHPKQTAAAAFGGRCLHAVFRGGGWAVEGGRDAAALGPTQAVAYG